MSIRKIVLLIAFMAFSLLSFSQNIAQANKLYKEKKYDEAFAIYSTVKSGSPQFAESRYHMGQISFHKQDYSKAEEYLKQAIAANGNVAKYHVAMSNVIMRMISNASMIKQASLASKLRSHLEEAVRLNPNDMNSSLILIGFYKQAPGIMGGSSDKATALAESIMKRNKAEGHMAQALIYQLDKDFARSEEYYKKSIAIAPDSVRYYYSLAQFYQGQSKPLKALETYELALTKFPENRNLLLQAGRVLATAENVNRGKAIDYLNRYITTSNDKSDRSIADAYYYLGLIEKNRNNKQLALTHLNNALKVNPDHRWAKEVIKEIQ